MSEYRFSPIKNQEAFDEALGYIAKRAGDLSLLLCGDRLPVSILKIFAHSDEEYQALEVFVKRHGQRSEISSGNSFYVKVDSGLTVANTPITLLGVRKPDPAKSQVGCGDYEVENFQAFASQLLSEQPEYARPADNAHGLDMVELWHPGFDILGYIVPVE